MASPVRTCGKTGSGWELAMEEAAGGHAGGGGAEAPGFLERVGRDCAQSI